MTELTRLTAAETAAAVAAGEVSAVDVARRPPGPDRRRRRRGARVPARRRRRRARGGSPAVDAAGPRARPLGPLAGVPLALKDVLATKGVPDHVRLADPRGLAAAVRRDRRPRGCARPASSSSARPTWTSSRWARSTEHSAYGPTHNPWDLDAHPRRLGRRLGGRGRRLRGAAGDRHRHRWLDPPAGGGHGDGRRQADVRRRRRATGSSRSRPRSTRPGRAPAPCSTRRCCTR